MNPFATVLRALPTLLFPQGNLCHVCGRALHEAGESMLCEGCADRLQKLRIPREEELRDLSELTPCVTAYRYEDEARTLDLRLKFGGDSYCAHPLAEGMAAAYANEPTIRGADIVIPVPLHPRRERERGYNQAALLARAFCEHTGLPLVPEALWRVRNTKAQSGKTREERLVGMEGAFEAADSVRGKRVLLIDDVLTTGATLLACADALIGAGAWDVMALTASRA